MTNPVDRILDRVDAFQRAHSWAAFLVGVSKKFGDDRAGSLAALVAYYAFFSLFPLLLMLVTVLGLLLSGNPELRARVLESALAQFPVLGDELEANVGSLDGSGVALTIGLFGALWAGMGAMRTLNGGAEIKPSAPPRRAVAESPTNLASSQVSIEDPQPPLKHRAEEGGDHRGQERANRQEGGVERCQGPAGPEVFQGGEVRCG